MKTFNNLTRRTGFLLLAICLGLGLIGLSIWLSGAAAQEMSTVSGVVLIADGPAAGARVRIRATNNLVTTTSDGAFTLIGLTTGITVPVTAWYPGYYISETEVVPPASNITLTLTPYPQTDNPDYAWIFPHRENSPPQIDYGCNTCHASIIVAQWENNAHARAATDPRFLSLYNGTDVSGSQTVPPGYQLDFPGTAGNCATCHAPGAAVDAPFTTNMNELVAPESDGVFCDLCHKTAAVALNPITGLPDPTRPGVLSHDLRRPPDGLQMFFGPFDDVPEPDTYLPLIEKSQFCAGCHSFSFWGVPIYGSYNEWLDSAYADQDIHCQDCHMAPDGITTNFAPGAGGFERDPMTIATHLQSGANDEEFLQEAVTMNITASQTGNQLVVTVAITNTGAGHAVPTGFPGRHMILTVQATDAQGQDLVLQSGSTVPDWGGDEAGLPGVAYAKVLRDVKNNEFPVVNYWSQDVALVSDNRIPALGEDITVYTFRVPPEMDTVTVTAVLQLRHLFQTLSDNKGWATTDVVMEEAQLQVGVQPGGWQLFMPLIRK